MGIKICPALLYFMVSQCRLNEMILIKASTSPDQRLQIITVAVLIDLHKKEILKLNQLPTFSNQKTYTKIWISTTLKKLHDLATLFPFVYGKNWLGLSNSCPLENGQEGFSLSQPSTIPVDSEHGGRIFTVTFYLITVLHVMRLLHVCMWIYKPHLNFVSISGSSSQTN